MGLVIASMSRSVCVCVCVCVRVCVCVCVCVCVVGVSGCLYIICVLVSPQMKKGDSIHRFLAKVLDSIRKEFTELRCYTCTCTLITCIAYMYMQQACNRCVYT